MTEYWWILLSLNPYWLVTVSSFQGSDAAAHYPIGRGFRCQYAFSSFPDPNSSIPSDPGDAKRLRCSQRRSEGRSAAIWKMVPSLSDRLLVLAVYQVGPRCREVRLRKAARIRYHRVKPRARGNLIFCGSF